MYTMLSFMIGTVFVGMGTAFDTVQDRISILFYIAAFMVFMSIAALPFFIQTRAVFARERRNGAYGPGPYVISNFLCALPGGSAAQRYLTPLPPSSRYVPSMLTARGAMGVCPHYDAGLFVIALLSSVIIYFMANFHSGFSHFANFVLALFLSLVRLPAPVHRPCLQFGLCNRAPCVLVLAAALQVAAEAFMSVMAALVPHYIIGMALGAGVFGMFMLMEGFFAQPHDIPLYWRWAYYVSAVWTRVAKGWGGQRCSRCVPAACASHTDWLPHLLLPRFHGQRVRGPVVRCEPALRRNCRTGAGELCELACRACATPVAQCCRATPPPALASTGVSHLGRVRDGGC